MEQNYTLRATLTLVTGCAFSLTAADIAAYTLEEGIPSGGLLPGATPAAHARLTLLNPEGAWQYGGSRLGERTLPGAAVQVEIGQGDVFSPAGCFTVSRIEADEGASTLTLSGYDGMVHALAAPFTDTLEYPQPLSAVLAHIVSQSGLALSGAPACNAGVQIAQKPAWGSGCTLRRALGWTAGALGCYARFDRAGALTLCPAWPAAAPAALPVSQALSLSVSGDGFRLNRVRITPRSGREGVVPVEAALDASLPAGAGNTLEMKDNALFRPAAPELQTLANGLLAALSGMEMQPFTGEFCCDPTLTVGSRVQVADLRGGQHAGQILSLRLRVERGVTLALSCEPDTAGLSLPSVLSGSGLLSGSALSDGIITARHLAAGAVDAGSIITGKLNTDRLIVGGTEFSIVRALNQLAQTLVEGDDRISGSVLADHTVSAVKVTDDFGAGLELSSNAAVLVLAGKLDGTHSHLELTESAVNMVGGAINIATEDLQIRGMENGEEIMSLTPEDGLHARMGVFDELRAPNMITRSRTAAVPWLGSIQKSLDAFPRWLSQDATLAIPDGVYYENVTITGFLGAVLTLTGSNVVLRGTVHIANCARVQLTAPAMGGFAIHPRTAAEHVVLITNATAELKNLNVSGYRGRTTAGNGSQYGVTVDLHGCAYLTGCCIEYTGSAVRFMAGSTGYVQDCSGGESGADPNGNANLSYGIEAISGAHAGASGTCPMGGAGTLYTWQGTLLGSPTPTAGGLASNEELHTNANTYTRNGMTIAITAKNGITLSDTPTALTSINLKTGLTLAANTDYTLSCDTERIPGVRIYVHATRADGSWKYNLASAAPSVAFNTADYAAFAIGVEITTAYPGGTSAFTVSLTRSGAAASIRRAFTAAHQCQYIFNTSESSSTATLSQGRYGDYYDNDTGWRLGALWFDLSALAGRTVVSASIRLRRASAGYSQPVPIGLCAFQRTWANHRNVDLPQNQRQGQFTAAAVAKEAEFTADVTALMPALLQGYALGIYDPMAAYNRTQQCSDHYANIYALGSAYEPVLTVIYN